MITKRFITLVLCLMIGDVAAKNGNSPEISEVFVDFDAQQITVFGSGFDEPTVSLGDEGNLQVIFSTDSEIETTLPPVPDGDYKLSVSQGKNKTHQDDYDLTIGAVGPEGPQGPQGLPGATGAPGQDGNDGAQGFPGISGLHTVEAQYGPTSIGVASQGLLGTVDCPPGEKAISGGTRRLSGDNGIGLWGSNPDSNGTGWEAWWGCIDVGGHCNNLRFKVYANCAVVQ